MKYLALLLSTALTAVTATDTDTINATATVVVSHGYTDNEVCPLLVNQTYEEFYNNDQTMQSNGGACSCLKRDNFEVICGFYYCQSCYDGFCVGRADKYNYGSTYVNDDTVEEFKREYLFMGEYIPFSEIDALGNQINEGNWTEVIIKSDSTSCTVIAMDDLDTEVQMCTCQEVTCGNNTIPQYSFDCTEGRSWGSCNATQDTFNPDDLTLSDPLVVLNENYFPWAACFD